MKIIQVVGSSNSGKTQFIEDLIGELGGYGSVGCVKHLGHHDFALEDGKDTTRFFEKGAQISVGVDGQKSVFIVASTGLEDALTSLCDAGMKIAIIEGFKGAAFPKIVIGDLEIEGCVLRNPLPSDVPGSLDQFEDFYTIPGLVRELKRECDVSRAGAILTFNGIVREITDGVRCEYMDFENGIDAKLADIQKEMESIDGILGVKFYHRKGRLFAGEDITYLAILAEHRHEAFRAVSDAIDRLKREIHDLMTEMPEGTP